jgi:hypothetical protein
MWYSDPIEPGTISELRCAGFNIQKADNAQNPGISAVHSRIEARTLKIIGSACPNLTSGSQLYQYQEGSDKPADDYHHAMDALRYLIYKIDGKRLARKKWLWQRDKKVGGAVEAVGTGEAGRKKVEREWLSVWNEELWTRIY